jgi:hypothetical protein
MDCLDDSMAFALLNVCRSVFWIQLRPGAVATRAGMRTSADLFVAI